jgi:hypothetical protein
VAITPLVGVSTPSNRSLTASTSWTDEFSRINGGKAVFCTHSRMAYYCSRREVCIHGMESLQVGSGQDDGLRGPASSLFASDEVDMSLPNCSQYTASQYSVGLCHGEIRV